MTKYIKNVILKCFTSRIKTIQLLLSLIFCFRQVSTDTPYHHRILQDGVKVSVSAFGKTVSLKTFKYVENNQINGKQ